ncbi:homogentisate phytyltransferase [Oscillatoriales cyanobacterium LEGE 11467]|uniref:Homogentisate phytyltransferase n=1 Tax=Zarconia navalis LEGE 11467 TaxID=1828826 RepID=A0A928VWG2_9CYAN|nr:homogentisate phytyltransferase [Zarconia navalis]MBE9041406.1 homogentisate phytyltransferase [Zarconia navalis LEGE 11467]
MSQTASSSSSTPWLYSLWKFSRPHTIIGTSLSVLGLWAIALSRGQRLEEFFDISIAINIALTWLACICGNIYIVGLNQLEDIEIDRINKPHLPIAAGEFSPKQGTWIVAITGLLAIFIATFESVWLLATVGTSLFLGTAYSLPPIRLKRFPFWASFCIFTVRGVVINLGLFLHFNGGFPVIEEVRALTLFVLVFTFAIAIFKDIPDIEGDREYNITTLTLRLGTQSVFNLARWVLTGCYLAMAMSGFFFLPQINPVFLSTTHLGILGLFWWRSQNVDLNEKREIASCYQFIWKLFFLEYIIFSAACFL